MRGLRVPGGAVFSRKKLDELTEKAPRARRGRACSGSRAPAGEVDLAGEEEPGAGAARTRSLAAAGVGEGDLLLIVARPGDGRLRRARAPCAPRSRRELKLVDESQVRLLLGDGVSARSAATRRRGPWFPMNHPFTGPARGGPRPRLESDPGSVRARAYDVVVNGWELGSGSIRIHRADLQERVFRVLGISAEAGARALRVPARGPPLRRAAARRHRPRPRPHLRDRGGRDVAARRDRVPEDDLGHRPDDEGSGRRRARQQLARARPRAARAGRTGERRRAPPERIAGRRGGGTHDPGSASGSARATRRGTSSRRPGASCSFPRRRARDGRRRRPARSRRSGDPRPRRSRTARPPRRSRPSSGSPTRRSAAGLRRDDAFVAVGGGVVTDVVGFAAAILLRGVAWNAVPTTTARHGGRGDRRQDGRQSRARARTCSARFIRRARS